ncbi:hypothetical protein QMM87_16415 [Leptospira santarosai]|uniref:hypothetical protein n=1 Tax=Leptospira santarosai TaxID=28183 RepID=UPI0024AFD8E6|nr:hypothetical protein [Leptospira santarosai]MDI7230230.1 hypothetical protein [Leptospira santarosai]
MGRVWELSETLSMDRVWELSETLSMDRVWELSETLSMDRVSGSATSKETESTEIPSL